jgi:DNA processing protein
MENEYQIDVEPLYLYILSLLPVRKLEVFEKWRQQAGSFEAVYLNPPREFAERLAEIKREHSVEKLLQSLQETRVNILPYYDERYPKLLKEIYDAPPVLFYRGKLGEPDEACVAIVGSRKMTSYGAAVMPTIAKPLIDSGITIVSGMAYGADGAAHAESIKAGARTIAVLGSGVDEDSIYPRAHLRLAHDILDHGGLIISEQPPGTPGYKNNFIARNRIIAGLSLGVVIIECKTKSGALLTADYAADFNRNLYAVPGPIYSSLSAGPHNLIKNGATLITSGKEILEDLNISSPEINLKINQQKLKLFTDAELRVLECMQDAPITLDALVEEIKISSSEIANAITMLEIKNAIKNLGAQGFIKI